MPIDLRRRDAVAAVVSAYDHAAEGPLPHDTARLLATMFPSEDVCQRSLLGGLCRALTGLCAGESVAREDAARQLALLAQAK